MTTSEAERTAPQEREFIANAHVLVIDDDADIHALVVAMLRPLQATIVGAATGAEGLAAARTSLPDLILLDHELPDGTGIDILHQLRSEPALAGIPVISVTGSESRQVLTACFAAGAADYIRKPFFGAELRARVCSVIERQRMLAQLGRDAHIDKLTGLPNRALLHARLQAAIDRAELEPGYAFAVMFIDFDRFKIINDSLGHDVGDLLLTEIASRLRENLRVADCIARHTIGSTVARLGGDEFVIVLDDVISAEVAAGAADRLLAVLEQPYYLKSHNVRSSASIGIVHSCGGYTKADDMLRDADIAMYEAKRLGKARHALFTTSMREAVRHRLYLENSLRDAITRNALSVMYQPIVSLVDRSLESVEALVRWRHPVLGMIQPSEFIPVAEETRLILPMSDFVLREACRQFMQWQREIPDFAPAYISVNLSRIQLADPDLVRRTMEILRDTGIAPHQVQLEVTESQLMQHRVMAGELLAAFKAEGFRLAMDDFGSGYSSLSCLQEYPFDVLKVDRALTENVSRGRGYSALLHAVITLAENLGMHVVAEGIENIEQLALLQALGCPAGQGYFLARPMEASHLEGWWATFVGEAFEAA